MMMMMMILTSLQNMDDSVTDIGRSPI